MMQPPRVLDLGNRSGIDQINLSYYGEIVIFQIITFSSANKQLLNSVTDLPASARSVAHIKDTDRV